MSNLKFLLLKSSLWIFLFSQSPKAKQGHLGNHFVRDMMCQHIPRLDQHILRLDGGADGK